MEKILILLSISLMGSIYGYPIDAGDISDQEQDIDFDYLKNNNSYIFWNEDVQTTDMILSEEQMELYYGDSEVYDEENTKQDNGLKSNWYRWPQKTVVYYITPGDFTDSQIKTIEKSMNTISSLSCVRFRKKTKRDKNYLLVQKAMSCSAHVGYQHGIQHLNLNPNGCIYQGVILHELLHVLGFHHMQNHPNRNRYVKINWENIAKGAVYNFKKMKEIESEDYGTYYDYWSIMHYSKFAYSINGKPTIVPFKNVQIGNKSKLSDGDVYKLKRMYNCF